MHINWTTKSQVIRSYITSLICIVTCSVTWGCVTYWRGHKRKTFKLFYEYWENTRCSIFVRDLERFQKEFLFLIRKLSKRSNLNYISIWETVYIPFSTNQSLFTLIQRKFFWTNFELFYQQKTDWEFDKSRQKKSCRVSSDYYSKTLLCFVMLQKQKAWPCQKQ